jgi:hypothetical protein
MKNSSHILKNRGYAIIYLIVIIFIFSAMLLPIVNLLALKMKVIKGATHREQALQIADAGVNYFQWHLAHFPTDYIGGTHDYIDKNTEEKIGEFTLDITPPETGSTIVTIKSTGSTVEYPNIKRTVTARYGIPSLAKYAFLSNSVVWIGDTESVSGEMLSNDGIRFDGTTNAPVQSAKETYTCSAGQGNPPCPTLKDGVWGSATQAVKNLWKFPVPAVDFSALTANLNAISSSTENQWLLPPSGSGKHGYSLVFNSNGTVTVRTITSLKNTPQGKDVNGYWHTEDLDYQNTAELFTDSLPENGLIFIQDNVWVEGTVKGKALVVAAKLPYDQNTAPTIYIPDNIVYDAKDGTNNLGLIAQKDIVVTYNAPSNLEINAALVAQNGSVQFYYYQSGNVLRVKNQITTYGSTMSHGQWTWSWVSGGTIVSGYPTTNSIYDSNLLFSPPPSFPLSSSGYEQMDWLSN